MYGSAVMEFQGIAPFSFQQHRVMAKGPVGSASKYKSAKDNRVKVSLLVPSSAMVDYCEENASCVRQLDGGTI